MVKLSSADRTELLGILTPSAILADERNREGEVINATPAGLPKQISVQNNFVRFADATRIQYATSTLPNCRVASVGRLFESDRVAPR